MTAEEIRKTILQHLPGSTVEIRDTTGGGDHFEAVVVATEFSGKSVVEQHRLVYGILGEAMEGAIHALALRTLTPEQRERSQASRASAERRPRS